MKLSQIGKNLLLSTLLTGSAIAFAYANLDLSLDTEYTDTNFDKDNGRELFIVAKKEGSSNELDISLEIQKKVGSTTELTTLTGKIPENAELPADVIVTDEKDEKESTLTIDEGTKTSVKGKIKFGSDSEYEINAKVAE